MASQKSPSHVGKLESDAIGQFSVDNGVVVVEKHVLKTEINVR
jgi:hypothetical protein